MELGENVGRCMQSLKGSAAVKLLVRFYFGGAANCSTSPPKGGAECCKMLQSTFLQGLPLQSRVGASFRRVNHCQGHHQNSFTFLPAFIIRTPHYL